MKHGQFTNPEYVPVDRTCAADGCKTVRNTRGYCNVHHRRLQRLGRLDPYTYEELFWQKVDKRGPNGCWLWTSPLSFWGYGTCHWSGRPARVHRLTYEMFVGPIPEGYHVDHMCNVRHCVNPDHLQALSASEHMSLTRARQDKSHCVNGHEYTPENLRINSKGARYCGQCMRDRGNALTRARAAAEGREVLPPPSERTHCPREHEYNAENTRYGKTPKGKPNRTCRVCGREANRRYQERKKESAFAL